MSDSIEALQSALTTVNTLGEQLTQGLGSLQNHNTDPSAHDDIRQTLKDLMDSDKVYTKEQIEALISDKVDAHAKLDITAGAHNGTAFKTWIDEEISRLEELISQGGGGGSTPGGSTPEESQLITSVQEIANRYAAILSALQSAYTEALASGQTELAENLLASIKETLAQQRAEMISAINEFNSHYTDEEIPESSSSEEIAELTTRVENIATSLNNLTGSVTTNTANINALRTDLDNNSAADNLLTGKVNTNTQNISTNASAIATNATNIATNASNISTNTALINAIFRDYTEEPYSGRDDVEEEPIEEPAIDEES